MTATDLFSAKYHPAPPPTLTKAEHAMITLLMYLDGKPLCEAKHDVPITGAVLRKLIADKYVQVIGLSPARYRVTGSGQVVRANGVRK